MDTTRSKNSIESSEKLIREKTGNNNATHVGSGPYGLGEAFLVNGKTHYVFTPDDISEMRKHSEDLTNNPQRGWNGNEGSVLIRDDRR